jgi:predicted Zn-dependent peptidase
MHPNPRTLGLVAAAAFALVPAGARAGMVPFTKYALPNGLTVILAEEHSVPLVAVNVLYKVGSRFEEPRRTGFAHLFEHLMFMGTHRVPTKMFDAWLESEGGWNNAWTSEDRTDYFDVGPARTVPLMLWLEADRLQSLGADVTQAKLDAQRDVVRNERRQTSENEPYGKVELRLPELLWPEGHPYHHPVIGSHEDLVEASVDDVKGFFGRWYVPGNASLVIAGDFDPAVVKPLVERWFGGLETRPVPPAPAPPASTKLASVVRETIPDNVNLPRVVMAWQSPAHFAPGDAELDLAASILHDGKSSRLYKALVYDQALAQDVTAMQESGDLGSRFVVQATARPGVAPEKLEAAMDAIVAKLAAEPARPEELLRAKNQVETAFIERLQSVRERASILNQYQASVGDPGYADADLARYRAATAEGVRDVVRGTLDPKARVILTVVPKGAPADAAAPKPKADTPPKKQAPPAAKPKADRPKPAAPAKKGGSK